MYPYRNHIYIQIIIHALPLIAIIIGDLYLLFMAVGLIGCLQVIHAFILKFIVPVKIIRHMLQKYFIGLGMAVLLNFICLFFLQGSMFNEKLYFVLLFVGVFLLWIYFWRIVFRLSRYEPDIEAAELAKFLEDVDIDG